MKGNKDKNQTILKKLEELFDDESQVSTEIERNNEKAVVHIKKIKQHLKSIQKK